MKKKKENLAAFTDSQNSIFPRSSAQNCNAPKCSSIVVVSPPLGGTRFALAENERGDVDDDDDGSSLSLSLSDMLDAVPNWRLLTHN